MTDFDLTLPNSCHVETRGSHWYFNGDTKMYLRIPKIGHRQDPTWGDENAGPLRDNFWHPYQTMTINHYYMTPTCTDDCCPHLLVLTPEGPIMAPNAKLHEVLNRKGLLL